MSLTKRQFLEIFRGLPAEKLKYPLFHIGGKDGFATWEKIYGLIDKNDKASRIIKDKFTAGKFYEKTSCLAGPRGYKLEEYNYNTIIVSSDMTDMTELGKLIDTYNPTDFPWMFTCDMPNGHHKFLRVHESYHPK